MPRLMGRGDRGFRSVGAPALAGVSAIFAYLAARRWLCMSMSGGASLRDIEEQLSSCEPKSYRAVLRAFVTGVTDVTSTGEAGPRPHAGAAFSDVPHRATVTGAPILHGAATWLDRRLVDLHVAGDHRIAVGEVLDLGREPLVVHAGRYRAGRDRYASKPMHLYRTDSPGRR